MKQLLLLLTLMISLACKKEDLRSSEKKLLSFHVEAQISSKIDEATHTISVVVPPSFNLTRINPTITVSPLATISPANSAVQDFTNPVVYKVTAEDGSTQAYTVKVEHQKSSSKQIIVFHLDGEISSKIDESTHTVSIVLPAFFNLTKLTPSITVSPLATVSPANSAVQDFTNPVVYKVTAEDGSVQTYTVKVENQKSPLKQITAFSFLINKITYNTTINQFDRVVSVTVPAGTNVKGLVPTIKVNERATVVPASGVAQDFDKTLTYTVTAEDGTKQSYFVVVLISK